MNRTVYSTTQTFQHVTQAARTNGTVNGTTVDRMALAAGYQSMMFVIQTGTLTDGTATVVLQDSDDGSAWATAATADTQGTVPTIAATADNVIYEVGYKGTKRYVRLSITSAGTTTGGIFGAVVVLGTPRRFPTAHV